MQNKIKGRKPKKKEQSNHWGMRFRQFLEEHNLSHREAAKLMNVAPSVVDGWAKGVLPTDLRAIKKLTDNFGVSFSWLLTGEREAHQPKATVSELFTEVPYFDGLARIQIHRLLPKASDNEDQ